MLSALPFSAGYSPTEVKMMSRPLALAALLLALGLAAPTPAQATTLSLLTLEQMTDASDLVVRGVVTELWAERDDNNTIWTRAQVEVQEVLKGAPSTRTVVVDQMGGVLNNEYQIIHSATRFSVGEEAYFFLEQLGNGRIVTAGMFQGKFTVRIDPATGDEMVVQFANRQDQWYDHRFIPHPPEGQRPAAVDLEARVQVRVEQGWDGKPIPGANPDKLRRISPPSSIQQGVK